MQRMSRKESRELTRDRLRRSAVRGFAKNGVAGTGIDAIVQDAGYSRGAFYSNYSSKLELLIDLLDARESEERKIWREAMDSDADLEAALPALAAHLGDPANMRENWLLAIELQLEADRNEVFRKAYSRYLDTRYDEMRQFAIEIFRKCGKATPDTLDTIVVIARILTLGLGSESLFGNELAARTSPSQILLEFFRSMIHSAPDLPESERAAAHTPECDAKQDVA